MRKERPNRVEGSSVVSHLKPRVICERRRAGCKSPRHRRCRDIVVERRRSKRPTAAKHSLFQA